MEITTPFLTPQMRATLAREFDLKPGDDGCTDVNQHMVPDFELMARTFRRFGYGADVTTSMKGLRQHLHKIPLADQPRAVVRGVSEIRYGCIA